jgi:hypothetical protein
MGQALQSAPAGHHAAFSYERRGPEETTLYQVVQEHVGTFLAQVEAKTGTGLPEIDAAHSFILKVIPMKDIFRRPFWEHS